MRIHSLTARFLLTLLLSTALPFLMFGWFVRGGVQHRLEEQALVHLPRQVSQGATRISSRLRQILLNCSVLAVAGRKALSDEGDVWDFRDVVEHAGIGNTLDLVLLVDGDGTVVAFHHYPGHDPKTAAARMALIREWSSVRDLGWFQRISEGLHWEDRHRSPFLHRTPEGESSDPADYSMALAIAVPTETGELGAVYALIRWQEMQRVLDEAARFLQGIAGLSSARVFLCDETGAYLAHTQRSAYGSQLDRNDRAYTVLMDAIAEEKEWATGVGDALHTVFAPVGFEPLPWWVGLQVSSAELFETSNRFGRNLLVITAVTVLLLVAWAMFASRGVLRPVRRLAVATEAVARGDLTARVPARGQHELADLGRAFNHMAEDLQASREQLKNAERQAAWGEMARQVAHEIKNPLTPMRMSAQLLIKAKREGDARLGELTDRLARTVIEQTEALTRIASDFRQFAGPPVREIERISADAILADAERHLSAMSTDGVQIEFSAGAGGAVVAVDRQEMRRVFLNLVHNAVAACGEQGRVLVESVAGEFEVVFRVVDDGPGIPADFREKLFDPYFTTKSSGTGLGLAICRRIMRAHEGRIVLETSEPGRTVFRLELPRVDVRDGRT